MPEIREHSDELLRLIVEALPIEGDSSLVWDDNLQCALTFNEDLGLVMTLDEVVEAIFLNWVISELPTDPEERANALEELLQANHEWRMTEGGALGLDPDTGFVTLSYRVDLPLDDPALIQDIIVKLYNISQHWQKTLRAAATDEASESADEDNTSSAGRSVRDAL